MRYAAEPSRADVEALAGAAVVEFGAHWCPICQAAQPLVEKVLGARPDVRHLRVEDGPGRPLGRHYRVKLWPTLVFLRDGREVARVVRPRSAEEIEVALAGLDGAGAGAESEPLEPRGS